ncbi:30S ribosomal protein S7 [archaeon]|nr:30S ribosomal protein S7 [archaeon]
MPKEKPKKTKEITTEDYKIFNKWTLTGITMNDLGLKNYINLEPTLALHTHGRHSAKQFSKKDVSIIERLINSIMRSSSRKKIGGHIIRGRSGCGKKNQAHKAVREAFEIINQRTQENPIQILVNAIENAAPREETTRVKYGGMTRHIAVDISPQRRVDFALRNIAIAALGKSFKNKKNRGEALAEELMSAANEEAGSLAIAKKNEAERIARGAR